MVSWTWEDQIALNTSDALKFDVLPAVGKLEERINWTIPIEKLNLPKSLDDLIQMDSFPLPIAADREGYYGERHYEYWLSGLEIHSYTMEYLKKYGVSNGRYVELGAASGRVIRHMATQNSFDELWAFDINWRHVAWMQKYLPVSIKAVNNTSIPHLPLEDNSVDCISAMSVFTHIENFETAWLAELRRILRPGGIALISVVTEHQLLSMDKTWPLYAPLIQHPCYNDNTLSELAAVGKIVLRWIAEKSYSSNVIYSTDYVHREWGRFFEILEHKRQFPIYQDFLVLRKPVG